MGEYLHLLLAGIHPVALGLLPTREVIKITHTFTHLSILAGMSLPHPQLRDRMSHPMTDRGFSKQHVTLMTATGGGHTRRDELD